MDMLGSSYKVKKINKKYLDLRLFKGSEVIWAVKDRQA